jgi:hypothetical protein
VIQIATFATLSDAEAVMAPLYAKRAVSGWNDFPANGGRGVRVQLSGRWQTLTGSLLGLLEAA